MDDYGRQAFDNLVRVCPNGATILIDKCIQIISRHTHVEQQPELRLAMMALAETVKRVMQQSAAAILRSFANVHLVRGGGGGDRQWIEDTCRAPEYAQQFAQRSSDILRLILMPGLAWKPGRVEATLRKVALAGLLAALKHTLISAQTIQDARYEVIAQLLS